MSVPENCQGPIFVASKIYQSLNSTLSFYWYYDLGQLKLRFLIYKVGLIIVISQGCFKDHVYKEVSEGSGTH